MITNTTTHVLAWFLASRPCAHPECRQGVAGRLDAGVVGVRVGAEQASVQRLPHAHGRYAHVGGEGGLVPRGGQPAVLLMEHAPRWGGERRGVIKVQLYLRVNETSYDQAEQKHYIKNPATIAVPLPLCPCIAVSSTRWGSTGPRLSCSCSSSWCSTCSTDSRSARGPQYNLREELTLGGSDIAIPALIN